MSGDVRTLWRFFRAPTETTHNMPGTPDGSTPASRSQSVMTLPEIRTVTPIEPFSIPRQPTDESILTVSSAISHDSRTTALTSPSSLFPESPTGSRLNVPLSHSLRKSISVDSFIKTRPSDPSEPGPSTNTQPFSPEGTLNNNKHENWFQSNHTSVHGQAVYSLASLGRTRGHSLSGASAFDRDDIYLDDSELERVTDLARLPLLPSHRSRLASAPAGGKGKGKGRLGPGNVLLLPPHAPPLSNASSTSSLSSIANSSVTLPPVPPIPPLHHRRPNVPEPLIMPQLPRRSRSGSFGARASFNFWNDPTVSIAVVGPSHCGKSTVIRKGLKPFGVSDKSSFYTVLSSNGRLRYESRTINAPHTEDRIGHVLEIDSDQLHLDSPDGAWPKELPHIDGVLVCYDASDAASFERVPDLLACYHALHLSTVAIACKCDLEKKVLPHHASERAAAYNVGLVEVTSLTESGKKKMRRCFYWLMKAIEKSKRGEIPTGSPYRNPASPDVLDAPWSDGYGYPETRNSIIRSRVSTPSAGSPSTARFRDYPLPVTTSHVSGSPTPGTSTPTARPPSVPTSPVRVRSTNDLVTEVERSRQEERHHRESSEGRGVGTRGRTASMSAGSFPETLVSDEKDGGSLDRHGSVDVKDGRLGRSHDPPPIPWATLEELLEKLFFLAVSGDDPTFIKYFFLTYRKFATPRSVLLGMQKRIRQLNQEHGDVLIGSYAQMRICDMLVEWIEDYPTDFAAPGTSGAITALVKQISSNPCTLHYGSDILPFLDEIPNLQDVDASWAIHSEDSREESDDDGLESSESMDDDDDHALRRGTVRATFTSVSARLSVATTDSTESKPKTRDRKSSLPLSAKLISAPLAISLSGTSDSSRSSIGRANTPMRNTPTPKDLVKITQKLTAYDPLDVAQQITKMQSEIFLAIEPRQWLRYTMGDAKLGHGGEPISASANFYNQLANWVSSLILAHDRVKYRERQVERFVELAGHLRMLNNYVGLRAVMTGISNATFPNDEILTLFRDLKIKQYQQFLGWEILLNSQHNHRAYRLALRHTSGPCIPDMEVHTFDMVRANESNPNYKTDDPSKIHWGKFTLMARMITMLQGLQEKIRSSGQFDYPERKWIRDLLNSDRMEEETMRSRVYPPPDDAEPIYPLAQGLESPTATRTDAARFKRLFFLIA